MVRLHFIQRSNRLRVHNSECTGAKAVKWSDCDARSFPWHLLCGDLLKRNKTRVQSRCEQGSKIPSAAVLRRDRGRVVHEYMDPIAQ
jgi:hypothetical protein